MAAQVTIPHCWFGVEEICQSPEFSDRYDEDGEWVPPKRRGSNVRVRDSIEARWFQFNNWRTEYSPGGPNLTMTTTYKYHMTWSFYYDEGTIWLYQADATMHRVGDGLGNDRIDREEQSYDHSDSSDDDDDDDDDDDGDRRWHNWQPLRFTLQTNWACYAEAGAYHETLDCQQKHSEALQELLPDGYHAEARRHGVGPSYGGLNGEFHILVALIAISVSFDNLVEAFCRSLRQAYTVHRLPNARPIVAAFLSTFSVQHIRKINMRQAQDPNRPSI